MRTYWSGAGANSFFLENKSEVYYARTIAPFEVRSSSLWLVYNRDEVAAADPLKMRKRIFIIGRGQQRKIVMLALANRARR